MNDNTLEWILKEKTSIVEIFDKLVFYDYKKIQRDFLHHALKVGSFDTHDVFNKALTQNNPTLLKKVYVKNIDEEFLLRALALFLKPPHKNNKLLTKKLAVACSTSLWYKWEADKHFLKEEIAWQKYYLAQMFFGVSLERIKFLQLLLERKKQLQQILEKQHLIMQEAVFQ